MARSAMVPSLVGAFLLLIATPAAWSANAAQASTSKHLVTRSVDPGYLLGPGDQITIWALGVEEISDKPVRLDTAGYIDLPLLGRMHAAGLTVEQLKQQLLEKLKTYVKQPQVAVSISDFQSQPVSVIGAVNKAGVFQVQGRKTLLEMLSMAEGLRSDAGSTITVTRSRDNGALPLPGAKADPSGQYNVAEIRVSDLLDGRDPQANLAVRPHDVITVSRAQTIYVMGEVKKAGGFVLGEKQSLSALQALALAEGPTTMASTKHSKILRDDGDGKERQEIALDLSRILSGKAPDVSLRPNDILFIPNNRSKSFAVKAVETAVNVGSGIAIWRVGLPPR